MSIAKAMRDVVWILLTEQRASMDRLQHETDLPDAAFGAMIDELTRVKRWAAVNTDGDLVWTMGTTDVDAKTEAFTPPSGLPGASQSPTTDAERRQLTVMFCDLEGSTALSGEFDPEDMNELISSYQNAVTPILKQFDGFLAKYMGDGILAYFGYPKAQEKDPERAIYAALAIIEAIRELDAMHGPRLAVRIGIATGTVIVGELIGEGEAQERAVVGDTPNLAARLQDVAPPNSVVISSVTRDLTGQAFVISSLGMRQLKGISAPVEIWQVRGEQDDNFLVEADTTREKPALVGRQEEVGLLMRVWQQSRQGAGQVVSISGEAGLGKSRLVEAILSETAEDTPLKITLRCSPHHMNSGLFPTISQIKRVIGWAAEDTEEERVAKLESVLATYQFPTYETVPLFASLLSLSLDPKRHPPLILAPQQLRLNTLDAVLAWLFEEAERKPTIAIWEDIHWADPSTLELLEMMIEQCPTAPILNILTFRPEFVAGWPQRAHILPITLNRLERPETEKLILQACEGKSLPREVVDHIAERSDGVPLFINELTSGILTSDALKQTPDGYELAGPLESLSIPATLQDSLLARLDRAPNIREVAQLGAVFGREFAYESVQAIGAFGEAALRDGLDRLVEDELLYKRGRLPRTKYMFKHALIQDAAYRSLLKRTRQRYHAAVAKLLQDQYSDAAETQPEILAHHFTEAGKVETALHYWLKAGQNALGRSENFEAIGHLNKGLALLPGGGEFADRELAMLRPLATAYMAAKGYAAPETVETFERARQLCSVVKDESVFPVMFGVWLAALVGGQFARATEMTVDMHHLVETATDPYARYAAHAMSAHTYLHIGDQVKAQKRYLKTLEIGQSLDPTGKNAKTLLYGLDLEVSIYGYSAWTEWLLGFPDTALDRRRLALQSLEKSNHSLSQARALYWCAVVDQMRGDYRAARKMADQAIDRARPHGLTMVETACRVMNASACADLGEGGSADELGAALNDYMASSARFQTSYLRTLHARLLAKEGRFDDGLDVLHRNWQMIRETGEEYFLPEVLRLRGELLLAKDEKSEEAPSLFREAIDLAAAAQVRSLELRAATSLAKWHSNNGNVEEGKAALAPCLSWFTEGFETRDFKDAQALLANL